MTDDDDLKRSGSQRLHLIMGSPWGAALSAWRRGEAGSWQAPSSWSAGDLLLTVLDTKPRSLLCLERAATDGIASTKTIKVTPDLLDFAAEPAFLLQVPAISNRLGRKFPPAPSTLPNDLADAVLIAVREELADPSPWRATEGRSSPSYKRERSTGLKASLLARNRGVCLACERDFGELLDGRGEAALEIHHLSQLAESAGEIETSVDDVVLLCGGCHNIIHLAAGGVTIEQLRYEWRPACPHCGAHHARQIVLGRGLAGLSTAESDWDGGCIGTDERWSCGACGWRW